MFDNAGFLIGAYAVISAGLSISVARLSPSIGPRLRHVFSGVAPLAMVLAVRMDGAESVVLHGMDLFAAGGLAVLGIATSSLTGKFVPTETQARAKLHKS